MSGEALERLTRLFRERLKQEWPAGEVDVTEIEERVARIEREVSREITTEMIREQTGKRDANQVVCPCGHGKATYRKQTTITLVTAFGRVRAERAYYYCGTCRDGHCPQDRAWGLGPGYTTPTVQSIVSYLAAKEAYTGVPATLKRLRPEIHLGTKTVEEIAQRVGAAVGRKPPRVTEKAERALTVGVDAAILLIRGGGKEARCGVIYEPDWEAGRTPEAERGLRKEYFATLGSRDQLMATVCAQVERASPDAGDAGECARRRGALDLAGLCEISAEPRGDPGLLPRV